MSDLLINRISKDLGIPPIRGESEESFAKRALYSAARFQIEGYCFDDNEGGKVGVRKQSVTRRFNEWIRTLARIYPWCLEWFDVEQNGAVPLYDRLIDVDDIVPTRNGELLRVSKPRIQYISRNASMRLGFYDPSLECDTYISSEIISGLATLICDSSSTNGSPTMNQRWWEKGACYLEWMEASSLGEIQFADAGSSRWSIGNADVWCEEHPKDVPLFLARRPCDFKTEYYAIEIRRGKLFAASINWRSAESLFFLLRSTVGNSAVARARRLDDLYCSINAPIGFIAPEGSRWIDAITWPVASVSDNFERIVRVEALGAIESILNECNVELKEE